MLKIVGFAVAAFLSLAVVGAVEEEATDHSSVSVPLIDVQLEPSLILPPVSSGSNEDFFGYPVEYPQLISSPFGPRWKLSDSRYDFHPGIDIFSPKQLEQGKSGTTSPVADLTVPVNSIAPGIVYRIYPNGSSSMPNSGNVVSIRHILPEAVEFHGVRTNKLYSLYMHLDSFASGLVEGATVSKGQRLGMMGKTGSTNFVHLYFETRLGTLCSFPYQEANPSSSCAHYHFEPKINPLYFLPRFPQDEELDSGETSEAPGTLINLGAFGGTDNLTVKGTNATVTFSQDLNNDGRALVTLLVPDRRMLSLNRIIVDLEGVVADTSRVASGSTGPNQPQPASAISLDFTLYTGFEPKNLTLLDSFDSSLPWGGLFPGEFTSTSSDYNMSLSVDGMNFNASRAKRNQTAEDFSWTSWRGNITFVDIWGHGVRAVLPLASGEQIVSPPSPTLHPLHNATFAKEDPKGDICNAICSGLAICAGSGFVLIFGAIVIKVYLAHKKTSEEQLKEHIRLRDKYIEQEQKDAMELELLKNSEKKVAEEEIDGGGGNSSSPATYSPPLITTEPLSPASTAVLSVRDPTTIITAQQGSPSSHHPQQRQQAIASWNNESSTTPPSFREPPAAVMRIEGMTPQPYHHHQSGNEPQSLNRQTNDSSDDVERLPIVSAMVARGNAGGLPVMSGGKTVIHQSQNYAAQGMQATSNTFSNTATFNDQGGYTQQVQQQSSSFTSVQQQQQLRSEATVTYPSDQPVLQQSPPQISSSGTQVASPPPVQTVQSHAGVHFDDI